MFTKSCPYCHTTSYCATNQNPWLCPKCNEDITYDKSILKVQSEKIQALANQKKHEEASAMSSF